MHIQPHYQFASRIGQAQCADRRIAGVFFNAARTLYASIEQWRRRRRTLRALADLDERLLRDIGIIRGETEPWWLRRGKCGRALAALDESETCHLSELGRQLRRKARHGGSG